MSYSLLRITSVSDLPLIKWSCRLLVSHHVFNRMNSLGIVLSFSADSYFIRNCKWWDKRKRLEIFYYSGHYSAV